jgi:hypothetical protein
MTAAISTEAIEFLKQLRPPPWILIAIKPGGPITAITAHSAEDVEAFDDGADPYEIIDTRKGKMERWRAIAQETGELSALVELNKQIRSDSAGIAARLDAREAELNARADAISSRELQHAVKVTQFVDFVGKASVLSDRLQAPR